MFKVHLPCSDFFPPVCTLYMCESAGLPSPDPGIQSNTLVMIIFLLASFQIDADKTKSGGAKFPDDSVSDNVPYVSMKPPQIDN